MLLSTPSADVTIHHSADQAILDYGRIHVWLADLDSNTPQSTQLSTLSQEERARAERLRDPLEKQRYISKCAYVRRVLGRITGLAPETLEFKKSECGKPELLVPMTRSFPFPRPMNFSVSHSEKMLGFALAFGRDVGIDLEVVRHNWDPQAVAETFFKPEDFRQLQSSPIGKPVPFYRLWTRNEALAKMQGHGISSPHLSKVALPAARTCLLEFTLDENSVVCSLAFGPRPL